MKRIISDHRNMRSIEWALKVHSKEENGDSAIKQKFFLAHFLSEYTDDQSVIQLCFFQGLLPSAEIEQYLSGVYDNDPSFIEDCRLFKDFWEKELKEILPIAIETTPRQAMIIAAYVDNRLCKLEDAEKELISYKNIYQTLRHELKAILSVLFEKLPENLFYGIDNKLIETFEYLEKLYKKPVPA